MTRRYSVIVFDLGNTLIRFDHNISAKKLATLFALDRGRIYDLFFDSELTRAFEKGGISPREFHKKVSGHLGIEISYEDFVDIWNDIFWEDEAACALARQLEKTYRLFLLSNINKLHFDHIRGKFDVIKIFDEIILSYMVGAIKPDRLIFEDVIRRARGDKAGLLYIDDREDLVKEALSLEIDAIRFLGADELKTEMLRRGVLF